MLVNLLEETAVKIDRNNLIDELYSAIDRLKVLGDATIKLSSNHSISIDLVSASFAVDYNTGE